MQSTSNGTAGQSLVLWNKLILFRKAFIYSGGHLPPVPLSPYVSKLLIMHLKQADKPILSTLINFVAVTEEVGLSLLTEKSSEYSELSQST